MIWLLYIIRKGEIRLDFLKYECCGTATCHPPKSFFKNEKGRKSWLLMCFNTDFVYFSDGVMKEGKKYQCLLHSPQTTHIHGPSPDMESGFENDWIYIYGNGIKELVNELDIPVNESFSVEKANCLTPYIKAILQEEKMPMFYSKHYVSSVICDMFVNMARQRKVSEFKDSYSYSSVRSVRQNMLENYHEKFDLNKLAESSGYSVSRFCELYKKFYNSSPISDLINIRIKKAKYYLVYTEISVSEISKLCGFETVHYFSRIFKNQTGYSPMNYRNYKEKIKK